MLRRAWSRARARPCPAPRGRHLGHQIALQLPPLTILAGGQLEHPQRGARLAHHELPVPHARDGFRRQAAADQRGLHRVGARARQPMRVTKSSPAISTRRYDRSPERSGSSRCPRSASAWPDIPPARRRARPDRLRTAVRGSTHSRCARPSAPGALVAAAARPRRRAATLGRQQTEQRQAGDGYSAAGDEMTSWLGLLHAVHLKAIPSAMTFLPYG